MLGAAEAVFELRFIERIDAQEVSTTINKFPAVVGHKGTVAPLILNGQISNYHCEINWNWVQQEYQVQDGMEGKPSTNHIYSSANGGELVQCDRAILKTPKDRVYLLRTIDGKEGYLELFDPNKQEGSGDRSTLDLDPRLVEFRATAIEAKSSAGEAKSNAIDAKDIALQSKAIAEKNSAAIGDLETLMDPRVRQSIAVLQMFGTHPRMYLAGGCVIFFTGLTVLMLLFLHANMDDIYKSMKERSQQIEQRRELDRQMNEGG